MAILKMSENWEKLHPDRFMIGKEFTTFRGYNPQKAAYCEKEFYGDSIFYVVLEQKDKPALLIGTARPKSIEYKWSDEFTLMEIRKDTYKTWKRKDFERFLEKQYGIDRVFGIFMSFRVVNIHMEVLR